MRELVGWIKDDGDEYHDFRYARPDEKRPGIPPPQGYLPVYFIPMCGPCEAKVHDDCHRRVDGAECGCVCTNGLRVFMGAVM